MYLFDVVCIFLFLCVSTVQMADGDDCKKQCPTGMIPKFCTQSGSDDKECVDDTRDGMKHGHWDMDYNKGNRCILRCNKGYVPSGCHVQRKWIDGMPTCVKDDWKRTMKEWGKTGLKVTAIGGVAIASGTALVVATPPLLGVLGFTSAGVAAGSTAAAVQTVSTASGSLFAWAQSVGAVGYVGTTGSVVIGGGSGTAAGGATTYALLTGCEKE